MPRSILYGSTDKSEEMAYTKRVHWRPEKSPLLV